MTKGMQAERGGTARLALNDNAATLLWFLPFRLFRHLHHSLWGQQRLFLHAMVSGQEQWP
jgi:hypothetical protein